MIRNSEGYKPRQKINVITVVITFELFFGCRSRVIYMMNLFVEAITHYKCVGQGETMRLHGMPFLVMRR